MIVFTEKDHKYFDNDYGEEYTSVSRLIGKYKKSFDREFHSKRSALSILIPEIYDDYKSKYGWDSETIVQDLEKFVDPSELELVASCFKQQWSESNKISTDRGTAIHSILEENSYAFGGRINPFNKRRYRSIHKNKNHDNESFSENLFDLGEGFYPELLVFNKKHKIAGQIDGCFISKGRGGKKIIDLIDYKTDKKIYKKPKFFVKGKGYPKLKSPLSHMLDCNLSLYTLKMSTYSYLLELHGFYVRSMYIYHYKQKGEKELLFVNGDFDVYEIPYKKEEVLLVFKDIERGVPADTPKK